ncbi:hypothetical protein BJ322DRAFT_1214197 [Thelephora terrestris]|uniref:Uncharacterized protein n=1 Tax=Thelephora terrestris TaxID=56493 RepID=A0A9P6L2L1_9AGAM|nr:hypothetical protein BJ322DRAFT_1214197 [Thelephora terrestris]
MDLPRQLASRGRCYIQGCACPKFLYSGSIPEPYTLCDCSHTALMHVKGDGTEVYPPHHCGGFIPVQQNPNTCVCGGLQDAHRPDGPPHMSSIPSMITSLAPIPGPSRPAVSASPITHVFSLPQQPGVAANEQRMISANRAATRNRGGIPSPASTPTRHMLGRPPVLARPRAKAPLRLSILFLPLYMKELQMPPESGVPRDFLQKFWLDPEDSFDRFLSRCKSNNLIFTVEVSHEDNDSRIVSGLIDQGLTDLTSRGGPKLPELQTNGDNNGQPRWELLMCKRTKVKESDLRGQPRRAGAQHRKVEVVEIKRSSVRLAPVEYTMSQIAKGFGFKDTLREVATEPEKIAVICRRDLYSSITLLLSKPFTRRGQTHSYNPVANPGISEVSSQTRLEKRRKKETRVFRHSCSKHTAVEVTESLMITNLRSTG